MFKKFITTLILCLFTSTAFAANINKVVASPDYVYVGVQNGFRQYIKKDIISDSQNINVSFIMTEIPEKGKGVKVMKEIESIANQEIIRIQRELKKNEKECDVRNRSDLTQEEKNIIKGLCGLYRAEQRKKAADEIAQIRGEVDTVNLTFKNWEYTDGTWSVNCKQRVATLTSHTMYNNKGQIVGGSEEPSIITQSNTLDAIINTVCK